MKELYLKFITHYSTEEGTQEVYTCWIHVPSRFKTDSVTNEQLTTEVYKRQAPMFQEVGLSIIEVTVERVSEFEYKQYLRSNKDKEKYHNALMENKHKY